MTQHEFFRTAQFEHAQAVRVADRVELAGQGGWDPDFEFPATLVGEIEQAFRNVDEILKLTGTNWDNVISVVSYHVGLDGQQDLVNETMAAQFRIYAPNGFPTWTCLGVAALGSPKMHVEIRVSALHSG